MTRKMLKTEQGLVCGFVERNDQGDRIFIKSKLKEAYHNTPCSVCSKGVCDGIAISEMILVQLHRMNVDRIEVEYNEKKYTLSFRDFQLRSKMITSIDREGKPYRQYLVCLHDWNVEPTKLIEGVAP